MSNVAVEGWGIVRLFSRDTVSGRCEKQLVSSVMACWKALKDYQLPRFKKKLMPLTISFASHLSGKLSNLGDRETLQVKGKSQLPRSHVKSAYVVLVLASFMRVRLIF